MGKPDGIAHGVLYLASDEAKFVTGAELDRMVITSAYKGLDEAVLKDEPLNGAIFIGTPPRGRGLSEARYGHMVVT